jgi:hypothetical protein
LGGEAVLATVTLKKTASWYVSHPAGSGMRGAGGLGGAGGGGGEGGSALIAAYAHAPRPTLPITKSKQRMALANSSSKPGTPRGASWTCPYSP